jgi:hypothetical protein
VWEPNERNLHSLFNILPHNVKKPNGFLGFAWFHRPAEHLGGGGGGFLL